MAAAAALLVPAPGTPGQAASVSQTRPAAIADATPTGDLGPGAADVVTLGIVIVVSGPGSETDANATGPRQGAGAGVQPALSLRSRAGAAGFGGVTKPAGFVASYLWVIVGIIAIAVISVAILAVLLRRAVRRRKDVRGLVAILRRNGEQLGSELRAPPRWSDVFRFIIRDEAEPTARLDFPQAGIPEYQVRRSGPGTAALMTPAIGEPYDVVVGGPGEVMDHNGLELAFRDTHRLRGGSDGWSGRRGQAGRPPIQRPAAPPFDPNGTRATPSAPPAPPAPTDEWL